MARPNMQRAKHAAGVLAAATAGTAPIMAVTRKQKLHQKLVTEAGERARATVSRAAKWARTDGFLRLAFYSAICYAIAQCVGGPLPASVSELTRTQQTTVMNFATMQLTTEHPNKPGFLLYYPYATLPAVSDVRATAKKWFETVQRRGTLADGHTGKSGRPCKVSLTAAAKDIVLRTIATNLFLTLKDMASHRCIAPILKAYDISITYLVNRLRTEGYPIDKCMTMEYKHELTPELRKLRVERARFLQLLFQTPVAPELSLGYVASDCVVWIDQKCLYIKPSENIKLWSLSDAGQRIGYGGSAGRDLIASHKLRMVSACVGLQTPASHQSRTRSLTHSHTSHPAAPPHARRRSSTAGASTTTRPSTPSRARYTSSS